MTMARFSLECLRSHETTLTRMLAYLQRIYSGRAVQTQCSTHTPTMARYCSLCTTHLPKAGDRRLLHSVSIAPVLNILCECTREIFSGGSDSLFPRGSHLYRQCVRGKAHQAKTGHSEGEYS